MVNVLANLSTPSEVVIRVGCFAGVLALMMLWEWRSPRRKLQVRRGWRWSSNLALVVVNSVLVRLVIPVTAVAAAYEVTARQWGVLNLVEWPGWLEVLIAVVLLDLVIYLQHVMFHAVPLLWRLHRVHHADLDIDVTTGLRFHTLEIVISAVIKLAAIAVLGATVPAVIIFEVVLNATAMFNHSNVRMPEWLDRWLRRIVVTPDMHRVHHSIVWRETNSNFGFNLPWWDYLMGTYRAQPEAGHEQMTIGVETVRDERQADRLPAMLWMPFTRQREQ